MSTKSAYQLFLNAAAAYKAATNNAPNKEELRKAKNVAELAAYQASLKKGGAKNTRKNNIRKNATRKMYGGKRKLSPYMKFANKVRPQLMKENPDMKVPELGKRIGKMWRDQK